MDLCCELLRGEMVDCHLPRWREGEGLLDEETALQCLQGIPAPFPNKHLCSPYNTSISKIESWHEKEIRFFLIGRKIVIKN